MVYISLAIRAVVCMILIAIVTHFGAITVMIKATSRTVIVLAEERSKEQGLVVSVHAQFFFFLEQAAMMRRRHRDRESQTI